MSLVRGGARVLLAPAAGWVGLFFALPLATVIVVSFWLVVNFRLVPAFALDSCRTPRAKLCVECGNTRRPTAKAVPS
jgi:hypothetical protein